MGNLSFLLWAVSFWFWHWKNFKNRPTFAKVTVKIKVAQFFFWLTVYCNILLTAPQGQTCATRLCYVYTHTVHLVDKIMAVIKATSHQCKGALSRRCCRPSVCPSVLLSVDNTYQATLGDISGCSSYGGYDTAVSQCSVQQSIATGRDIPSYLAGR